MKLPRDLSSNDLILLLKTFGYQVTRQSGSHIRLTTSQQGEHHITIPYRGSLRVGTLSAILNEVAEHFKTTRQELLLNFFGD